LLRKEKNMHEYEFKMFDKIGRLFRPILITEKIDGTNAQILVEDREVAEEQAPELPWIYVDDYAVLAGSRKRYLSEDADNFEFYQWVKSHAPALTYLGIGRHFGEWWGSGIQRGYGLSKGERKLSLFNVMRYSLDPLLYSPVWEIGVEVVPLLYAGDWKLGHVDMALKTLEVTGSIAAPGYMNPEGIVIFHTSNNSLLKVTLKNDGHKEGWIPPIYEKIDKLNRRE
jgi:hypothetical protein